MKSETTTAPKKKECPEGKYYNEITKRCNKIKKEKKTIIPKSFSPTSLKPDFTDTVKTKKYQEDKTIENDIKPLKSLSRKDFYHTIKSSEIYKRNNYNINCKSNEIINPFTLRCIDKNGEVAKNILRELNTFHMPFTVQKNSIITDHPGLDTNIHFGMLYLTHKYKNDCVVFPTIQKNTVSVNISPKKTSIQVPNGYWKSFSKCVSNKKRFIISPITLTRNNKHFHSNYLIYDRVHNELERFEPNGFSTNYPSESIDPIIEKTYAKKIKNVKYFGNEQFCPFYGYQKMEILEGNKLKTDPHGFCAAWSLFYADLRLGNPTKSRDEIIILGFHLIRTNFDTLKIFIRDYSDFFMSMRYKYQMGLINLKYDSLEDFFFEELGINEFQISVDEFKKMLSSDELKKLNLE